MEKKKRIYYWDNLKGLLMLLVVFGHFVETYGGYFSHKNLIWTAVYSFHMPAFALVSGYFIRRSSKDPIEKVPKAAGLYLMMMLLYTIRPFLYGKGFSMELASPKYGLWYLLFLVYAYVLTHFLNRKNEILILAGTVLAGMLAGFDSSVGRAWGIGQSIYIMPYLIIGACMDVDRIAVFARRHKKTAWTGFFWYSS